MTFDLESPLSPYINLYDSENNQIGKVVQYDSKGKIATLDDGTQVSVSRATLQGPIEKMYLAFVGHHYGQFRDGLR